MKVIKFSVDERNQLCYYSLTTVATALACDSLYQLSVMSAMVKVVIVVLTVILMLQCSCYATLSKKDRKIGSTKPSKPGNEVGQCFPLVLYQKNSMANINVNKYPYLHVYRYLCIGTPWSIGTCVWVPGVLALHFYRLCCNQLHRFLRKDWLQRQPSRRTLLTTITFGIKMAVTGATCQSTH